MRAIATLCAAALFALALAPSMVAAAEITRAEYKEAVEPICKTNTEANERILKGVRDLVKNGKLKPAAAKFEKAGNALKKAHAQLSVVSQPTADEAKLAKWLGYVKTEADLFKQVAAKLRANKKGAAQSVVNKLTTNANQANAQVLAFGFRYCRFEPSKFT
jgi:cellobiose-specific phosphotransferase system component IIA